MWPSQEQPGTYGAAVPLPTSPRWGEEPDSLPRWVKAREGPSPSLKNIGLELVHTHVPGGARVPMAPGKNVPSGGSTFASTAHVVSCARS